jgi:hypothetical protein
VQGQLRNKKLSFLLQTTCAHCGKPFEIAIDSDLNYQVKSSGADPLVFVPMVDFAALEDPSIIDAF